MIKKIIIVLVLGLPKFAFSQKAYDAIYYSGKVKNFIVTFTFAYGYLDACEVKTKDIKTEKTSRFLPDYEFQEDEKKMKFYHFTTSDKKFSDYFIIDGIGEYEEGIPEKFSGTYYYKDKTFSFTLIKL